MMKMPVAAIAPYVNTPVVQILTHVTMTYQRFVMTDSASFRGAQIHWPAIMTFQQVAQMDLVHIQDVWMRMPVTMIL
jgi:hypothetical protein